MAKIKRTPIYEWYTLAISEGDGFAYVNPNQGFEHEPGVDRHEFETYAEAKEYRDHYCDCPESIMILRETRQVMEETNPKIEKRWNEFPVDGKGSYLPCPLCNRKYCDHTPAERGDAIEFVKLADGTILKGKEAEALIMEEKRSYDTV